MREIARVLAGEFEVDEATAAADAVEFVGQLLGTRLLLAAEDGAQEAAP